MALAGVVAALVMLLWDGVRLLREAESGVILFMIVLPVVVAGIMLGVRYRREVREHPWHLLAGAGAGAAWLYFVYAPERVGFYPWMSEAKTWGMIISGALLYLVWIVLSLELATWLYRRALRALTCQSSVGERE